MIKNIIVFILNLIYPIFKKLMPFQVFAYLAVGAFNTAFNIGLYCLFYFIFSKTNIFLFSFNLQNIAVELATIFSFLITIFTGFWLNKNFAFTTASNEKKEVNKQFGKYFYVALQGQFADYLITKGLIIFLNTNPILAYFISTFIMLICNYFLQKYFTFKNKS